MPSNNVRERKVMHVGALVETTDKIFTLPNHNSQQDNLHDVLDKGAVGIIVKGVRSL